MGARPVALFGSKCVSTLLASFKLGVNSGSLCMSRGTIAENSLSAAAGITYLLEKAVAKRSALPAASLIHLPFVFFKAGMLQTF